MSVTKICSVCGRRRKLQEFRLYGRSNQCKACFVAYMKQWRLEHPDKQKAIERRRAAKLKELGLTGHENRDPEKVLKSHAKQMDRYRSDPEYRKKIRTATSSHYHGITPEEYLERRSKPCEICGIYLSPERKVGTGMHIDHDHATGALRGTLCQQCNRALGGFKDDPELLDKAAAYVRRYGKIG